MLKKKFVWIVASSVVLCGVLFAFRRHLPFYSSIRRVGPVALVLTGRSDGCTLTSAMNVTERQDAQARASRQIADSSRRVEVDSDGFELWDTPKGRFWTPPGNGKDPLAFALSLEQSGFFDGTTAGLRRGDMVLDCGAHLGVFTRKALAAGAKLVVAIEPVPVNLRCLRRTFADEVANGRVVIHDEGVWDRAQVLPIHFDHTDSMRSSLVFLPPGSGSDININLNTIDAIVSQFNLARVDYLKVHVEGAEMKAIIGARQTISSHKPRIAVTPFHMKEDQRDIPTFIRSIRGDYSMECGPCTKEYNQLRPEMLFFQ